MTYFVTRNFQLRFKPVNSPILSLLHEKFYTMKLKEGGSPLRYLEEMENCRQDMQYSKVSMTNEHFLRIVFIGLGPSYIMIVEEFERKIDTYDTKELIDEIRGKLDVRQSRMRMAQRQNQRSSGNEKALLAFKKKFTGKCYKCGKWGHKGADCKEGKNRDKRDTSRRTQCFKYKKCGHIKRYCPEMNNNNNKTDLAAFCQEVDEPMNEMSLMILSHGSLKTSNNDDADLSYHGDGEDEEDSISEDLDDVLDDISEGLLDSRYWEDLGSDYCYMMADSAPEKQSEEGEDLKPAARNKKSSEKQTSSTREKLGEKISGHNSSCAQVDAHVQELLSNSDDSSMDVSLKPSDRDNDDY